MTKPKTKSIVSNEEKCYFCGRINGLNRHHIFFGPNRKNSENHGLWVYLCIDHHTGQNGIHHGNIKYDWLLKRVGQREFEKRYGRNEFMRIFGKNYLED